MVLEKLTFHTESQQEGKKEKREKRQAGVREKERGKKTQNTHKKNLTSHRAQK